MDNPSRLKRLREHLDLNQRQMADELKVTHGAIGLWEAGDRPVPGPVIRLIELYEEELGLSQVEEKNADSIEEILTSKWSRQVVLSKFSAEAFGLWLEMMLKSVISSQSESSTLRKSVYLKLASKLAKEMGQMKGVPMKIGQMMGYLAFAMPEDAREFFTNLQTTSAPLAAAKVSQLVKDNLGAEPEQIFSKWTKKPFAMASIGQVHLARLKSGQPVAVKVQYPGIAKAIEADLKTLSVLTPFTKFFFRENEPNMLKNELSERFLQECDYEMEANNQELFRKNHQPQKDVVVPRVFKEFSNSRIICTEFLPGMSLAEFTQSATQEQRNRAGQIMLQFTWESILKHLMFNADPHPGNFLFDEGKVIFLDYGCTRRFSPEFIRNWKIAFQGTLEQNMEKVLDGLEAIGLVDSRDLDLDHIRRLMETIYEPCLRDEPYSFREDWLKNSFSLWFGKNPNKAHMTLAREWLFLSRVIWGIGAIMAKMKVQVNHRQLILPLLYDNIESAPSDLPRSSSGQWLAHSVAKTAENSFEPKKK